MYTLRCGLWALIALLPCACCISASAETQKPVQPDHGGIDASVVAAWTKVGAEIGWLVPDRMGCVIFTPTRPANLVAMPSFQFAQKNVPAAGVLMALPAPNVPFGLDFRYTDISDASLKELTGFGQLHTLNF